MRLARLVVSLAFAFLAFVQAARADVRSLLPFDGNTGWLNSQALTPASLRGKVVLVDFWEYTCINCLKTLPYEKAWYERYKQYGFVIVGVHTPEFAFAREASNVEAATKRLGITWPVVLDSNKAIWQRYANDAWPHEFLFDREGNLVLDHIGEGDYPQTETKLQSLIRAQNPNAQLPRVMALLPDDNYTKPGAVCYPQTPEVYASHEVGNGGAYDVGQVQRYKDGGRGHFDGRVYLQGPWLDGTEQVVHAAASPQAEDHLALTYHALQVVSVLKPEGDAPITVYVEQDGKPLARHDAGADIHYDSTGRSYITVDQPRAYELVMNRRFGHHELTLRPVEYGLGVYSFAFESCEVGSDR